MRRAWSGARWAAAHRWSGHAAGIAGGGLLVAAVLGEGGAESRSARWLFAAALVVMALQVAACRWAPVRSGVIGVGLAGLALILWPQLLIPSASVLERVGISAFWALPTVLAVLVGGYPRLMERRHGRDLLDARRAQQLELAHDLHDFVAHDVSGIVAQAQAARFVAGQDPAAALPALERIERAGLSALEAIDQSVALLRDPDLSRDSLPDLEGLRGAVSRFALAGDATTSLEIAPEAEDALSRLGAATIHRATLEALTNVRRHAPQARQVDIALTLEGEAVRLSVINDLGPTPPPRRHRGGTGLATLAERLLPMNGTLETAGHHGRWHVTVTLPADRSGGSPCPPAS